MREDGDEVVTKVRAGQARKMVHVGRDLKKIKKGRRKEEIENGKLRGEGPGILYFMPGEQMRRMES